MTDEASIWNRHGKVYVDPAFEKSALIVFVEFCSDMMVSLGEADAMAKRYARSSSIFHLGSLSAKGLGDAMSIEEPLWTRARGADLVVGSPVQVLVGDLRYCPSCLSLGNHSVLFQLPQVAHCPIHSEALRMGCPHCGKSISTTVHALAKNHLYCGSCHRNLATARRRTTIGVPVNHPPAERFAALRHSVATELPHGESRSALRWDRSANEIAASPTLARLHRWHTMWDCPSMNCGILRVKTESFVLGAEDCQRKQRTFNTLVRDATIKSFEQLAVQLEPHVRLMEIPIDVERAMRSAARFDVRVSSVAAAFWQSAAVLKVNRFLFGEMPPSAADAQPFSSRLPAHIGAMRLLTQFSVLALFAQNLIQMRRLQYGVQVAWQHVPDEALFLVPWRLLFSESDQVELYVRSRVDGPTVDRLVARYRHHWLRDAPKNIPLLRLIASRTPAGASETGRDQGSGYAVGAWPFNTD
jgi:hypothetical protein